MIAEGKGMQVCILQNVSVLALLSQILQLIVRQEETCKAVSFPFDTTDDGRAGAHGERSTLNLVYFSLSLFYNPYHHHLYPQPVRQIICLLEVFPRHFSFFS